MIDPTRQEVLQALAELSEIVPEIRLGQLVANLSYLARGLSNEAIGEMEDVEAASRGTLPPARSSIARRRMDRASSIEDGSASYRG